MLLAWRAFGDPAEALDSFPPRVRRSSTKSRATAPMLLQEISDAYDPVLAALPALRQEAESLTVEGFKKWQANRDPIHPAWGALVAEADVVSSLDAKLKSLPRGDATKKQLQADFKTANSKLAVSLKMKKAGAKARLKLLKAQIKALEKLEQERDERVAEVNRRAERETAEVQGAIADLQRICSDPDEARRYFVMAESPEVKENEFNLNLPRYVDTFDPEEEIELAATLSELQQSEEATAAASGKLKTLVDV